MRSFHLVAVLLCSRMVAMSATNGSIGAEGSAACKAPSGAKLFLSLNHISREARDADKLAEFYERILGFERIAAPQFEFKTLWLQHPSGVTMHLIQSNPEFRLAEGPLRDASTGLASDTPFQYGDRFQAIHLRRGHHLAFNIADMETLKTVLDAESIPYGTHSLPGSKRKQLWFFDIEGNGIEAVSVRVTMRCTAASYDYIAYVDSHESSAD